MSDFHYIASYEFGGEKKERVIKSVVEINLGTNLDNLLNGDFFRGSETSGDIEKITLEEISKESYNEIRSKKEAIGLIIGNNGDIESREVL